jgi:hypothetical protein
MCIQREAKATPAVHALFVTGMHRAALFALKAGKLSSAT